MKAALIVIATLALSACGASPDPAALKRQMDIMAQTGANTHELCAKATEVADAWLIAEEIDEYRLAKVEAAAQCAEAHFS